MNWTKATNEQLNVIFTHESDLPNHLLVGLVEEMMKRNLFEGIIVYTAKKILGTYTRNEITQAAHIGIYQLAKIFKPRKLSFKDMVFIVIERRLKNIIAKKYQKNNFMNQQALNNDMPEMRAANNVEQAVIRKLTLQEQLSHLSEKQRNIVSLFLEGYSLKWIGENVYGQDTSAIRYQFKDALRRMNIHDYKIGPRCGLKGA